MKIHLLILAAITLAAARQPRKLARTHGCNSLCKFPFIYKDVAYNQCTHEDSDKAWCSTNTDNQNNYIGEWTECDEDCKGACEDMSSYCAQVKDLGTLDCQHDAVADLCPLSCNKCAVCEDKNLYCAQGMEAGELDCSRQEMAEACAYTCNKCDHVSSAAPGRRGAEGPLMPLQRNKETCVDSNSAHCIEVVQQGYCGLIEQAHACPQSCGLCDPERSVAHGKREDRGLLIPLLRQETCADTDSGLCMMVDQDGYCNLPKVAEACPKSCHLCDLERSAARRKREDEGLLIPLLRLDPERSVARGKKEEEGLLIPLLRQETCVDSDIYHCMNMTKDGYCGLYEVAQACPKSCGLCEQVRSVVRRKREAEGVLVPLLRQETCADSEGHDCTNVKKDGYCGLYEVRQACPQSCDLCDPERSVARRKREDEGLLIPLLRQVTCADSDSPKCIKVAQTGGYCGTALKNMCPHSCGLCDDDDEIDFVLRKKREDEGLLIPLLRHQATCADSDSDYCTKVAQDGLCEVNLAKECPHSCGLCDRVYFVERRKRRDAGLLMPLLRQEGTCADTNSGHCMKVIQDNLCGDYDMAKECPQTCGLCECRDLSERCQMDVLSWNLCHDENLQKICLATCGVCSQEKRSEENNLQQGQEKRSEENNLQQEARKTFIPTPWTSDSETPTIESTIISSTEAPNTVI